MDARGLRLAGLIGAWLCAGGCGRVEAAEAGAANMDGYIPKPIKAIELREALEGLVAAPVVTELR